MSSKLNLIGKFMLVTVRGEKRMPLRVAESIPCRYQCSFYYKDFIFQTKQGLYKSQTVDRFLGFDIGIAVETELVLVSL